MKDFNLYQTKALETAIYPDQGKNIIYPALGLTGEAGEVSELIKKMIRDDGGVLTEERRQKLAKELGDVLWYVAVVAYEAGLMLGDVARGNIDKLQSRQQRGQISGSGSDR
jgi:NTP pyrophosphatase (non-canonical NTP hydrolase)